ncbi:hypothetical protein L596_007896 [Steinernema carpocapsae]|uniref:Uncharacterized protein n=1 Tax=Steinernema carpocapsae TaxID=34508 RepID=A0A4U5PAW2_STECR|nr:hypothetical protein L596_007896 [Steinernema carpocapsae]
MTFADRRIPHPHVGRDKPRRSAVQRYKEYCEKESFGDGEVRRIGTRRPVKTRASSKVLYVLYDAERFEQARDVIH